MVVEALGAEWEAVKRVEKVFEKRVLQGSRGEGQVTVKREEMLKKKEDKKTTMSRVAKWLKKG